MKVPRAPAVSAIILRGWFFYARCIGAVFFRPSPAKDYAMVVEESWWNRSWWKWISIIWRLVPACFHAYTYFCFISTLPDMVERILNFSRLVIITSSYLSMIHLQIFHGGEVIRLINRYLRLFYRVTALSIRSRTGFGGGRELWLIIFSLYSQAHEIFFFIGQLRQGINLKIVLIWACFSYILTCSNIIMRINCIWYLSIGVLYSRMNKCLRLETQYLQRRRRKLKLKNAMTLFREMSYLITSLQEITNKYLCFNMVQTFLGMLAISYKMIMDRKVYQLWLWLYFAKIMLDMLILSLAIEGAVNQFSYIRELTLEMLFLSELTEWHRTMEVFVAHLILYQFRVCLLGLFDVSNKFFPIVVSGMITYIVFILQYIMQLKV